MLRVRCEGGAPSRAEKEGRRDEVEVGRERSGEGEEAWWEAADEVRVLRNALRRGEVRIVRGSSSRMVEKVSLFSIRLGSKDVNGKAYWVTSESVYLCEWNFPALCAAKNALLKRKALRETFPRVVTETSEDICK